MRGEVGKRCRSLNSKRQLLNGVEIVNIDASLHHSTTRTCKGALNLPIFIYTSSMETQVR